MVHERKTKKGKNKIDRKKVFKKWGKVQKIREKENEDGDQEGMGKILVKKKAKSGEGVKAKNEKKVYQKGIHLLTGFIYLYTEVILRELEVLPVLTT